MRAEGLHATLLFIGEFPSKNLEMLLSLVSRIHVEQFGLYFDQARYWGHNHIVYAAPSRVPQTLQQLVVMLEQCLIRNHISFDTSFQGDYQPHITLLRKAHWHDEPLNEIQPFAWNVRDFVLLQSTRAGNMPVYRVLVRFPLGSAFRG